jgi:hypothetical protein
MIDMAQKKKNGMTKPSYFRLRNFSGGYVGLKKIADIANIAGILYPESKSGI